MVLGSVGTGKSSVLQCICGAQETVFESSRSILGCTQALVRKDFEQFELIDTMGLNSMQMPTAYWGNIFNQSSIISEGIDLTLLVFKCKISPDTTDFNTLAAFVQVIASADPANTALVFTFADQDSDMDVDYAMRWYETLINKAEAIPQVTKDRIFLYSGKTNPNATASTTQEL